MERPKNKWCREVIEEVRFKPDRDQIWDEMMAHIEDRAEELERRGYTGEEAEARAVAAMGDPAEVGKQLNAVHKPLLGWLWKLSGWVLAVAAVFFICSLFLPRQSYFAEDELRYNVPFLEEDTREYESIYPSRTTVGQRVFYGEPLLRDGLDRYTFGVERIALWQMEETVGGQVRGYRSLYALLTVKGFWPTEPPLELNWIVYGADSLGNRYGRGELYLLETDRTLTAFRYELALEELAPGAEWLELRCEGDPDFCLRIDLTGGEER